MAGQGRARGGQVHQPVQHRVIRHQITGEKLALLRLKGIWAADFSASGVFGAMAEPEDTIGPKAREAGGIDDVNILESSTLHTSRHFRAKAWVEALVDVDE